MTNKTFRLSIEPQTTKTVEYSVITSRSLKSYTIVDRYMALKLRYRYLLLEKIKIVLKFAWVFLKMLFLRKLLYTHRPQY